MRKIYTGAALAALFLLLITSQSCAPARFVRPLEKGQKAISANFGGPLIGFGGLIIPVPQTAVGFGYGLKENVTLFSHVHTTSLLFGNIHLDAGGTWGILKPEGWKPGVSITPMINFSADTWEGNSKLWPAIDLNAYWEYGKEDANYAYLGLSNWFELSGTRAHDEPQPNRWLPSIQAGNVFSKTKWDYAVELKYLVPGIPSQNKVVDYKTLGNTGAFGIYLGFIRKF